MSNASESKESAPPAGSEHQTALFSSLVMQQFSMAMMLMGRTKGPGGESAPKDLEAARLFIDQLEMLEQKTKGNLSKEEESFLKQSLMTLRLSFVEAVEEGEKPATQAPDQQKPGSTGTPSGDSSPPEAESHKKFTKKY